MTHALTVRTAVVLAGGLGTRLRSAVPDLPKPMAPVAGRPFLAHLMDRWIAQGIERFVLSVGYRHEAIRGCFGTSYRGADVFYAVEETPLGTGGGVLLAARALASEERFLLLNGDTHFEVELEALAAFAARRDADWCLALFRTSEHGRYLGVELGEAGRIARLDAGTEAPERLANGGVYVVHPRALRAALAGPVAALSLENDLFPRLLGEGQRFFGLACGGAFIDIGVPADYHRAAGVMNAVATPAESLA